MLDLIHIDDLKSDELIILNDKINKMLNVIYNNIITNRCNISIRVSSERIMYKILSILNNYRIINDISPFRINIADSNYTNLIPPYIYIILTDVNKRIKRNQINKIFVLYYQFHRQTNKYSYDDADIIAHTLLTMLEEKNYNIVVEKNDIVYTFHILWI